MAMARVVFPKWDVWEKMILVKIGRVKTPRHLTLLQKFSGAREVASGKAGPRKECSGQHAKMRGIQWRFPSMGDTPIAENGWMVYNGQSNED